MDESFSELVHHFKQNEAPEVVLLIADDPALTKIVIAWSNLDMRPAKKMARSHGESERERWDWLWDNADYSLEELAERAGLTAALVERKIKPLIANRVLYPDGTVNSFVQRYLRDQVLKLFDAKPKKQGKSAS
jgi:hypothetical protein